MSIEEDESEEEEENERKRKKKRGGQHLKERNKKYVTFVNVLKRF